MKLYIFLFAVLTISEVALTAGYYLLTKRWDVVLWIGFIIYSGAMITSYISCEAELYSKKRKEYLDSLP